jgi:hypothetical protein
VLTQPDRSVTLWTHQAIRPISDEVVAKAPNRSTPFASLAHGSLWSPFALTVSLRSTAYRSAHHPGLAARFPRFARCSAYFAGKRSFPSSRPKAVNARDGSSGWPLLVHPDVSHAPPQPIALLATLRCSSLARCRLAALRARSPARARAQNLWVRDSPSEVTSIAVLLSRRASIATRTPGSFPTATPSCMSPGRDVSPRPSPRLRSRRPPRPRRARRPDRVRSPAVRRGTRSSRRTSG